MKDYFKKSKSFLALVLAVLIAFTMTPVQGVQAATLKASATVKATAAITASGIITNSATKKVVSKATVSLMQGTKVVSKTTTDTKGKYTLTGLKANTSYTIKVAATGYATYTFVAFKTTKSVTKSKAIVPVFTVSGTIKGTKDAPLKDASVTLYQGTKKIGTTIKTDAKGNYKLANVPYGTGYTVKVVKSGYTTKTFVKFDVKKNVTGKSVTLVATAPVVKEFKVTGKVTEQGATPEVVIPNATVKLMKDTEVVGTATTTATGTYEIAKVLTGSYTLEVTADGYTTSTPVAVEVTTADKAQDVTLVKTAPTLTAISTVSVTNPTTVVVTLAKAEAGLTKDEFKAETGVSETTIATANTVTAAVAGTDNITYTLTLGTAIADTNYVKISASTTAAKISGNASAKYTAPTETFVSSVAAVNSKLTVTLSLAPTTEAQIADFTVTSAINGATATAVTPTAIVRNGLIVELTVPAVVASAAEQSVVYSVQYKTTTAKSATAFVIAASTDSAIVSVTVVSPTTLEVKLTPAPTALTKTNLAIAIQTAGTTDTDKKASAEAAAKSATGGTGVTSVVMKPGATDTYIIQTSLRPVTLDRIAVAAKGTGLITGSVASVKYIAPANIIVTGTSLGVSGAAGTMTFAVAGSYTVKVVSGLNNGKYVHTSAQDYDTPQVNVMTANATITGLTPGVTYEVTDVTDTTVKLQSGSIGTASAASITGLTGSYTIQVVDGLGADNGKYIVSTTAGTIDPTAVSFTDISVASLVNGVTYRIGVSGNTLSAAVLASTAATPVVLGDLVLTTNTALSATATWFNAITSLTLTRTSTGTNDGISSATIAKADLLTTGTNTIYVAKAKLPANLQGTYNVTILSTGYANAMKSLTISTRLPEVLSATINAKDLTGSFTANTTIGKSTSDVTIAFNKEVYSNAATLSAFGTNDLVSDASKAFQITAGTAANLEKQTSGAIVTTDNKSFALNFSAFTKLEPDTYTLKVDMTKVYDAFGTAGTGILTYQFKILANPILGSTVSTPLIIATTAGANNILFVAAAGGAPEYINANSTICFASASNYAAVKALITGTNALKVGDQILIDAQGKISAITQGTSPLTAVSSVAVNTNDFATPLTVSGNVNGITLTTTSTYSNDITIAGTGKVNVTSSDFTGRIVVSTAAIIAIPANKAVTLPAAAVTILGTTITAASTANTVQHDGNNVITLGGTGTITTVSVAALAETTGIVVNCAIGTSLTNLKLAGLDKITVKNGKSIASLVTGALLIKELVLEGTGSVAGATGTGTIMKLDGSAITGTAIAATLTSAINILEANGPVGSASNALKISNTGTAINMTTNTGNIIVDGIAKVTVKNGKTALLSGIKVTPTGTDAEFTLVANTSATLTPVAGLTKIAAEYNAASSTRLLALGSIGATCPTVDLELKGGDAAGKELIVTSTARTTGVNEVTGGFVDLRGDVTTGATTATTANSTITSTIGGTSRINGVKITASTAPLVSYNAATSVLTVGNTAPATINTAIDVSNSAGKTDGISAPMTIAFASALTGNTGGPMNITGHPTNRLTITGGSGLVSAQTVGVISGLVTIGDGTAQALTSSTAVKIGVATPGAPLNLTVAANTTVASIASVVSNYAANAVSITVDGTTTGGIDLATGAVTMTGKLVIAGTGSLGTGLKLAGTITGDIDINTDATLLATYAIAAGKTLTVADGKQLTIFATGALTGTVSTIAVTANATKAPIKVPGTATTTLGATGSLGNLFISVAGSTGKVVDITSGGVIGVTFKDLTCTPDTVKGVTIAAATPATNSTASGTSNAGVVFSVGAGAITAS